MLHLAFSGFGLLGSFDALLVEGFECFCGISQMDHKGTKANTRQRPSRLSNFGISAGQLLALQLLGTCEKTQDNFLSTFYEPLKLLRRERGLRRVVVLTISGGIKSTRILRPEVPQSKGKSRKCSKNALLFRRFSKKWLTLCTSWRGVYVFFFQKMTTLTGFCEPEKKASGVKGESER
jgi:hypothetical protein